MKSKFCLILCLFSLSFVAQNFYHSTHGWEKTPKVYLPTEIEKKADLVIVLQKKIYEIVYDSDGQPFIYETFHTIYHVNSPKAVDGVNKGYVSQEGIIEEVDLKARCITSDNKIIHFNKATLKSVDNLEDAGAFKIFAIDGVEAGCDVEILYTNKKQFYTYSFYSPSLRSPITYFETHIISPKNLVFEAKTYNTVENFTQETSDTTKNHLVLIQKNMSAIEKEKYSAGKANNMGYIFQLAYNTDRKKSKIYTWDLISHEFYASLYTIEKSETKLIEKILDKNKISKQANSVDKIKALDSFLKTTYEISQSYKEFALAKAIETGKMGNSNAMRFYIAALKIMQIPFELVLASQREDIKFDPKFPSYVFMKEFLLFFPETNEYISPISLYSRYGYASPEMLSNGGLFIKEVNIGEISSSTAKTKSISFTNYNDSYHNTNVKVTLDFDSKTVKTNVEQALFGYNAYYIQPIYRYLTNEQKEEIHKNYKLAESSENIRNFQVAGTTEEDLYEAPMRITFIADQNDFLENAGNKFIFKAGLLIGPQEELYQEDARKTPADMNYTHYLKRSIEINVPQGYKPTNLNSLIIDKTCTLDGKEIAAFKSSYELKDNVITIKVYEDYREINYPLSVFDSFKSVINAAADFNKKNIIFEKL